MLYRTPQARLPLARLARLLFSTLGPRRGRIAERDLAALSPHLRRDLGLADVDLAALVGRK